MTTDLFELSEEYEDMLRRGVSLSGYDPVYFRTHRVVDLRRNLPPGWNGKRILDFGCGTGETSAYLAESFAASEVVGVDPSENATKLAQRRYGSSRVRFGPVQILDSMAPFDLCYVNGVFHHIKPDQRLNAVQTIRKSLVRGGYFALFENNPWNPGTRMVMRRIAFDQDAKTLSCLDARRLLRAGGFRVDVPMRFLFYFPQSLSFLRVVEPSLIRVPLGAQYCVLAVNP